MGCGGTSGLAMLEDLEISKERKSLFQDARRLVVKLGTRVVTVGDHALNRSLIDRLAKDVAEVRSHGIQVAIVSSGAVGSGMGRLGLRTRPRRIPELQATAAVGQGLLMNAYKQAFREHSVPVGQVLLTSEDLDNRQRYVNARNTLDALFRLGAVPVVNENDSVAVEELELSVGDNDRLSALVAHLIDADLLVILTDVDGLHTEDPTRNGNATLIRRVEATTDDLAANAGGARSGLGLGGMRSKILAARSATQGGRPTIIANGHKVGLAELFAGENARITSPSGTDLTFSIKNRDPNILRGIFSGSGKMEAPPDVEVNLAPIEGTTNGRIVIDGAISTFGLVSASA